MCTINVKGVKKKGCLCFGGYMKYWNSIHYNSNEIFMQDIPFNVAYVASEVSCKM